MASAKTPPRRPVPTVFQVLPPSENGEDDHAEPTDPARSHHSVADVRRLDSGPTADNETGDDGKTELDDEDAPHSPTSAVPQPSASERAARADGFRRYAEAEERGVRLGIGAYRARGSVRASWCTAGATGNGCRTCGCCETCAHEIHQRPRRTAGHHGGGRSPWRV